MLTLCQQSLRLAEHWKISWRRQMSLNWVNYQQLRRWSWHQNSKHQCKSSICWQSFTHGVLKWTEKVLSSGGSSRHTTHMPSTGSSKMRTINQSFLPSYARTKMVRRITWRRCQWRKVYMTRTKTKTWRSAKLSTIKKRLFVDFCRKDSNLTIYESNLLKRNHKIKVTMIKVKKSRSFMW